MTTKQIAIKLAKEVIKGGTIYFDFKSYDNQDDVPHIFINGERFDVEYVKLSKYGDYMECSGDYKGTGVDYTFGISFIETTEEKLEKMNVPALLHDMYYETDESFELGDFECDFLGID